MAFELKELIAQRGVIKGRVTKFKKYLDGLLALDTLSDIELSQLKLKLSRIETLLTKFDTLQSQIEILNEDDQGNELNTRDLIEQDFDCCVSIAQQLVQSNSFSSEQGHNEHLSNCSNSNHCHQRSNHDCDSLGFKLPVIHIPKFDGAYYKWLEFKEIYCSLIHENKNIKNIHKFHYLSSYLEGEAARVLSNLEITNNNYLEAWALLCERYDNKKHLINNHLKSLFNIDSFRETEKSLRFVIDHVNKNLRALSTLGLPTDKWDILIIYILCSKLDNGTIFKWEEHRNTLSEIPSLNDFFSFLRNRADVLETVNRNRNENSEKTKQVAYISQPKRHTKALVAVEHKPSSFSVGSNFYCVICKGKHRIYECPTFKTKTAEERNAEVATLNLCYNCLRSGHNVQTCKLPGSCRFCKKRHNSLLHINQATPGTPNVTSITMTATSTSVILLCTARVRLINPLTKETIYARALLDSGSQSSFITESVRQRLNLTSQPSSVSIVTIGNNSLDLNPDRCAIQLESTTSSFQVFMQCLVLKSITDEMPKCPLDISSLNITDFELADPSFSQPSPIDMLIGCDLFWDLIGNKQHSLGTNKLKLRNSKLGWLVAGPIPTIRSPAKPKNSTSCNLAQEGDTNVIFDKKIQQFWELENVPQIQPLSEEEKLCEKHFLANTIRLSDGRFCVSLPLKDNIDCLGDSYYTAKKRLFSLEARFRKNPKLKNSYSQFIQEYADLGHLTKLDKFPTAPYVCFLSHHPVIKENSESTKLRVIFNPSEPTTSGFSLNDLQMVGPTIQDSLFNILLRFRLHRYVLSADIEKMFRQVLMKESDRDVQLMLWRENESDPVNILRLNTITYGFASASFLSTRCIWQIGEECDDAKIKTIIKQDFYCDDLLTGADTEEELRYIQLSVSNELKKGCFPLRKYRSNLPNLINCDLENSNLIISNATSALGIGWIPNTDEIHFPFKYTPATVHTKRAILSSIFKIFDPLGLLSACTITAKILLQKLWAAKLNWDEPVPNHLKVLWLKFSTQINYLATLKIPRHVTTINSKYIELHCFCDSSQHAYGACVYLRSIDKKGTIQVKLLCSKARVAPIKACTIPRLELCGALLGAQLAASVLQALRCNINRKVYWTDSSVVLGWLNTPNKTKTFVANRVAAITELTNASEWRHVPTADNPADLASRGVDPQDLLKCDLWWHGPSFLKQAESFWPSTFTKAIDLPEVITMPSLTVARSSPLAPSPIFERFSKLHTLQRVYSRVFRFYHNCKHPKNRMTGALQVNELKRALTALIRVSQHESFFTEILCLQSQKPIKAKANLISLRPFIDDEGLLRVGGRIETSIYSYDKRHPIILNANHYLTKLIFRSEHLNLLHAGPQHLLAAIRERYWPIGGRKLARDITRNCLTCLRFKGETMTNIMGNLPNDRVEPDFPFRSVAVDFGGPFLITDRKGRGCRITKCYLCLFICFRYKCIHLEIVSELTKNAFILTLKRFIARRGMPKYIYCDNGRNFVAAAKEIGTFLNTTHIAIQDFAVERGIQFCFSPAYAPHFNGLAEAGIKSAKFHLHRIIGQAHMTFEQLTSVFAQIEAILNSRPLSPLSPSPDDFQPLTPGHFLIGRPLTALPSKNYLDHNPNYLTAYERVEKARQHFWNRWSKEYVAELQQRSKWRVKCRNLKIDDLVIIQEANTPPLCWRLGRVSRLFPGSDGVPRVADITTTTGTIRRAINRLCLLPLHEGP